MRKLAVPAAAAPWACSPNDPPKDPPGPDGTSEAAAGSSCKQIKNDHPASASGVYWVNTAPCGNDVAQVYCDMDTGGGGWTMVLKLSAGVAGDPYDIWMGAALNDTDPTLLGTGTSASHYLSRIVPQWNQTCGFGFGEAAIRFYSGGVLANKYFVFDTAQTTKESWFSAAHLTGTDYVTPPDATNTSGSTGAHFSIAGDPLTFRRFFINRRYGAAPRMRGGWSLAGSARRTWGSATGRGRARA